MHLVSHPHPPRSVGAAPAGVTYVPGSGTAAFFACDSSWGAVGTARNEPALLHPTGGRKPTINPVLVRFACGELRARNSPLAFDGRCHFA